MKRIFLVIITIIGLSMCVVLPIYAEETVYSGTCGDGVSWKLDIVTGELIISGNGTMPEYKSNIDYGNKAPWGQHSDRIYSVVVEEGVKNVGGYSFYYCKNIVKVTLANSVIQIDEFAFCGCDNLGEVLLPDTLRSIGMFAFTGCQSLEKISFGDNLNYIGMGVFSDCPALSKILFDGSKEEWTSIILNDALLDKGSKCEIVYKKDCEHSEINYISDNNATCTKDGTKTGACIKCEANKTITDVGTAKGHSFTKYTPNQDATCRADATKTSKCDICDVIITRSDIGTKLPHSFKNGVCALCGENDPDYSDSAQLNGADPVIVIAIVLGIVAICIPFIGRRRKT